MASLTKAADLDHIAAPGPLYWSFRCLKCEQSVTDHPSAASVLWRKVRRALRR